jgi:choline dehydrogenase
LAEAFLQAVEETRHRRAKDVASGLEEGFGWGDLSIHDGRRFDAATAYLRPVIDRPNLHVVTDALVHRVTFQGDRCTGVEYVTAGERRMVRCAKEVILSAGAIGSPQLLMLSGIGCADNLRRLGITPVFDAPSVGEDLQDHPLSGIVYASSRPVPDAVNNHGEALGLISSDTAWNGPDLQITMVDVPLHAPRLPGPPVGSGYTLMVSAMTPRSRGVLALASADPELQPFIDPCYYSDERDLDTMVYGLWIARELGAAPALSSWLGGEALPGLDKIKLADLKAYVRQNTLSYNHYCGTCRMGDDEKAVVDRELRVRGVTGLRVVDASVLPAIVSANINATVYAIAERAVALITAS